MEYLFIWDNKRNILVSLDTQINETAVTWEIWSLLYKVFGEKESRRKIISWLLSVYKLANMGYVYDETPDMMGKISDSDIPLDQESINESIFSKNIDQLKRFFYNKWDKEKSEGKTPSIGDISKFGLNKAKDEIIESILLDPSKCYFTTHYFTYKDNKLISSNDDILFGNTIHIDILVFKELLRDCRLKELGI